MREVFDIRSMFGIVDIPNMTLSNSSSSCVLEDLRDRLRSLEAPRRDGGERVVSVGLASIDGALGGGLRGGAIHEWIGLGGGDRSACWSPPLCLMAHLAGRVVCERGGWVVWVGRRMWPYPHVLIGSGGGDGDASATLARSLFVRTSCASQALWAADLALRCEAVSCVVGDGSGMEMGATRRLQLAAQSGAGAIGLLARPPTQAGRLSAATTRWSVRRSGTEDRRGEVERVTRVNPRWIVELLRCKGMRPVTGASRCWVVELDIDACDLRVVADVVGGSDRASPSKRARRLA